MTATHKQCSRCKTAKPVAEFSRATAVKGGLARWCRTCHADCYRERTERRRQQEPRAFDDKQCSKCRQTLPAAQFSRSAATWDGLQSYCRACNNADGRARREARRAR